MFSKCFMSIVQTEVQAVLYLYPRALRLSPYTVRKHRTILNADILKRSFFEVVKPKFDALNFF